MTTSLLSVFEMVVRMSGSASVLILAILGLYCLLRRWLPMPVIYVLSLLVLVRLAIPYFPHSDYSLLQLVPKVIGFFQPETVELAVNVSEPINVVSNAEMVELEAEEGVSPLWRWIAMTWGFVFVATIAWQLCRYFRFLRWLGLQPIVTEPGVLSLLTECQKLAGVEQSVALLSVDRMRMPAVFGIIKPRILLPDQLVKQLSRTELKHILLHELCHVRRGDALIGLLASLIATVHWFNPLVWLGTRQFSFVRELLCDRSVLHALRGSPQSEQAYGETLLRAATLFSRPAYKAPGLVPFLSQKDEIKERLTMIVKPTSKHWLRTVAGLITGTGLAVASMTLVALPNPSAEDGRDERREKKERRERVESDQDRERVERKEGRELREFDDGEREGKGEKRRRDRDRKFEDNHDDEGDGRDNERKNRKYRDRESEAKDLYRDTEDRPRRSTRDFSVEKVREQINMLLELGRREQAIELERKLATEMIRRAELLAKRDKKAEFLGEENRKLKEHIDELSQSLRTVHEKVEKMQRKLDELSERD